MGQKPIQDEFTNRPDLNAGTRYHLRQKRRGRCRACGAKAWRGKALCRKHQKKAAIRKKLWDMQKNQMNHET